MKIDISRAWFSPQHEINIGGDFLLEVGELFITSRNLRNDDKMKDVKQLIPVKRFYGRDIKSCLGCGKLFLSSEYLKVHKINGCGRTTEEHVYYDIIEEDATNEDDLFRVSVVKNGLRLVI